FYSSKRGTTIRESSEQKEQGHWLQLVAFGDFEFFRGGDGSSSAVNEIMKQTKDNHEQEADYKNIRRRRKERSRLTYAAQICNRDERDEDQTQYDFVIAE